MEGCAHGAKVRRSRLNSAEIAISGRPIKNPIVAMPKQKDLLVPEALCAHRVDSLTTRPSMEQVSAQKGARRKLVRGSFLHASALNGS